MLASLVVVSLLGADLELTPPPVAPAAELLAPAPAVEDPNKGRGFLNHAYTLLSFGTTMAIPSGIFLGLVIAGANRCASTPGCFDEGGSLLGGLMTGLPFALGIGMLAVGIPLLIKGLRERYGD